MTSASKRARLRSESGAQGSAESVRAEIVRAAKLFLDDGWPALTLFSVVLLVLFYQG